MMHSLHDLHFLQFHGARSRLAQERTRGRDLLLLRRLLSMRLYFLGGESTSHESAASTNARRDRFDAFEYGLRPVSHRVWRLVDSTSHCSVGRIRKNGRAKPVLGLPRIAGKGWCLRMSRTFSPLCASCFHPDWAPCERHVSLDSLQCCGPSFAEACPGSRHLACLSSLA